MSARFHNGTHGESSFTILPNWCSSLLRFSGSVYACSSAMILSNSGLL